MPHITFELHESVALIRLNNGVTNPIGPELVEAFFDALVKTRQQARSLVLTGGAKFFSIGLDLPALITYGQDEMSRFWDRFTGLVFELYTLPMPVVCAMAGHAVAGGNVLALTGDYRLAGDGDKKIGLNEVKLGIPAPYLTDLALRQLIGDRAATKMLYEGDFITFSRAEEIGLVDAVIPVQALENEAVAKAARLAAIGAKTFAVFKSNRTEAVRKRYEKNFRSRNDTAMELWFSAPVQARLKVAAERF